MTVPINRLGVYRSSQTEQPGSVRFSRNLGIAGGSGAMRGARTHARHLLTKTTNSWRMVKMSFASVQSVAVLMGIDFSADRIVGHYLEFYRSQLLKGNA